jgi:hypothetical protein
MNKIKYKNATGKYKIREKISVQYFLSSGNKINKLNGN